MKKVLILILFLIISYSSADQKNNIYYPSQPDLKRAKEIAVETAKWFEYSTGKMKDKNSGQCGDYAIMFVLKYNEYKGQNIARIVVANNPIPNGTYRVGKKIDVKKLGFNGFSSGSSGFLSWDGQLYLYHPILGSYQIFLEKAWTPKKHFGVNMLDKRQVHVWASIGDVSVDPTYYDVWPDQFKSPLGKDE
jgi:hypothetical protein